MAHPDRKRLIIGNWKMNLPASRAVPYLRELLPLLPGRSDDREIAVAPAYTSLPAVAAALAGSTVRLAAQDLAFEAEGPYPGAVPGARPRHLGVPPVLVGRP